MNRNDNRSTIQIKDVFASNGKFIVDSDGKEIGKDLLRRKINGYISYVKGDNPLTFPYRILPNMFSEKSIKNLDYPKYTFTNAQIDEPISSIDLVAMIYQNIRKKYMILYLK